MKERKRWWQLVLAGEDLKVIEENGCLDGAVLKHVSRRAVKGTDSLVPWAAAIIS